MTTCMRCVPLDRCYCRTPSAELPTGSVVATEDTAYIRVGDRYPSGARWRGTNGGIFGDWKVDEARDGGARVLRVGNGQED